MVSRVQDLPHIPRFPLGNVYYTTAVARWAANHELSLAYWVRRHHCGDWGDLDPEDVRSNEDALKTGAQILSAYLTQGRIIYVITESDRSTTTVLFAEEY